MKGFANILLSNKNGVRSTLCSKGSSFPDARPLGGGRLVCGFGIKVKASGARIAVFLDAGTPRNYAKNSSHLKVKNIVVAGSTRYEYSAIRLSENRDIRI